MLRVGPVDENIEYTLNSTTKLEDINHETDIGVTVDLNLKFEMHMQAKINKAKCHGDNSKIIQLHGL